MKRDSNSAPRYSPVYLRVTRIAGQQLSVALGITSFGVLVFGQIFELAGYVIGVPRDELAGRVTRAHVELFIKGSD